MSDNVEISISKTLMEDFKEAFNTPVAERTETVIRLKKVLAMQIALSALGQYTVDDDAD